MASKTKPSEPEIIVKRGKPSAIIVPLNQYRDMLERLDDVEDLKALDLLRKKPLQFRKLEDVLK